MPENPRTRRFCDVFRYIIQTMDADDPNMDFIVSLWSFIISNGALTDAQSEKVRPFCIKYLRNRGINHLDLPESLDGQNQNS